MKIIQILLLAFLNFSYLFGQEQASSFTKQQQKMIMSADDKTAMRVFKINNREDSLLLRTKSQDIKVDPSDPVLKHFIKRLYATVTDSMSLGAGIAAPQVGILKNIIWVQRFDKENLPFEVYLNPKILQYSEQKYPCREGCLSIPGRSDSLNSRAYTVLVDYDLPDGSHKTEMMEEFTSVILQHEVDHLNGIVYLDHLQQERADAQKVLADSNVIANTQVHNTFESEDQIRAIRAQSNAAYERQDVPGIASSYASGIVITGGGGTDLQGSKKISSFLTELFEENPGLYYIRRTGEINVHENNQRAWESGRWREVPGTRSGKYSAHWIKEQGQWKIKSQVFVTLRE